MITKISIGYHLKLSRNLNKLFLSKFHRGYEEDKKIYNMIIGGISTGTREIKIKPTDNRKMRLVMSRMR